MRCIVRPGLQAMVLAAAFAALGVPTGAQTPRLFAARVDFDAGD
jgi:hypothetical protein